MKLKKILVIALGVFTLLSNTVTVQAKTRVEKTSKYFSEVNYYKNEIVKGCLTGTGKKWLHDYWRITQDMSLSDPMAVHEIGMSRGTIKYYTRRSKVSLKFSSPNSDGYMDTTVTFKPIENLVHIHKYKPDSDIEDKGTVYDIYNSNTLNSYKTNSQDAGSDIPYNDENGAVFTQVLDRYTGTNLMSGLKDVVDSNGVEFKNACEFKAKGRKWIVQVDAKKTKPTKKNPYGTLVFKVHHHKDYKGLAFGQFLDFSSPYGGFSGNIGGALMSVDYSKRFKLADFMGDEWLHGDYTLVKYK